MASGQGSHWLIESPKMFIYPPEICVNLVFKNIHAASSYTIRRQFVPYIYCPEYREERDSVRS